MQWKLSEIVDEFAHIPPPPADVKAAMERIHGDLIAVQGGCFGEYYEQKPEDERVATEADYSLVRRHIFGKNLPKIEQFEAALAKGAIRTRVPSLLVMTPEADSQSSL